MGNEQRCFAMHRFEEGLEHLFFCLRVKVRSRLIEDQDGASFSRARAIASLWRSPPDRRRPCSPINVSYPLEGLQ